MTTNSDGSLSIGDADGQNGLISGSKSLLFLFPQDRPAVVLSVELSDFDEGDFVMMEFSNDQSSRSSRKRAEGFQSLQTAITDTSAGSLMFV